MMTLLTESKLPLPLLRKGKVREVYEADREHLLIVASDRVSAFDVVMREAIPRKGAVLTQISAFWFDLLGAVVPSHFITARTTEILRRFPTLRSQGSQIAGRTMLVRRATPIAFECVVRGYLSGSAWKEYREHGTLAGEPLPPGLVESSRLEPAVFSPATKEEAGHDINIPFAAVEQALGITLAARIRDLSFAVYAAGRDHAATRGIIIADTKFEFGLDAHRPGRSQPSFDKQPLRDYLSGLRTEGRWNGEAPPPPLPVDVVEATSKRYLEAFRRLTGFDLPEDA
jgi:phosphoribosylaminoimidazole-succinocarboxamide synthase